MYEALYKSSLLRTPNKSISIIRQMLEVKLMENDYASNATKQRRLKYSPYYATYDNLWSLFYSRTDDRKQ
jgi:hypothetical protein